jgi:hypothetical protein
VEAAGLEGQRRSKYGLFAKSGVSSIAQNQPIQPNGGGCTRMTHAENGSVGRSAETMTVRPLAPPLLVTYALREQADSPFIAYEPQDAWRLVNRALQI